MSATREQIFTALLAVLADSYPFKAIGRRLRDPENVASNERPALYLVAHDDEYRRSAVNLPPIREFMAWAVVYTDAGTSQNAIPVTEQNNILDAIDAALAPGPDDDRQTLGGLVYAALIDGTVQRASGDVTGKGVIAIPIKIIIP